MPPAIGLFLLWLWTRVSKRGNATAATTSPAVQNAPMTATPATAVQAQAAANHAAATAAQKPTAANQAAAQAAANYAAAQKRKTLQVLTAAKKAPAPWPSATPPDLPPFPSGWEPDTPPPPAVVTRAWQLLPILWKTGKGTKKVETIKGRWITFVAADHGGGKKGVTAFRVKQGATGLVQTVRT